MAKSSQPALSRKPAPKFPLWIRKGGTSVAPRWCKKIRGKLYHFGYVADDPKGEKALGLWQKQKDDLLAGRIPREYDADGCTVGRLCNLFLAAKKKMIEDRELQPITYHDYRLICDKMVKVFTATRLVENLRPEDFARLRSFFSRTRGPVAVGNDIQRVRVVCKFGFDNLLIDAPVRYGGGFKRPSRKTLRLERAKRGSKMIEAADVRKLIEAATPRFRAMLMLAINCGFGATDCGKLPTSALDLDGGWVNYPRPKTGIERRCPLWPETITALKVAIELRRPPKLPEHAALVFTTFQGGSFATTATSNPTAKEFAKLAAKLEIRRPGVGFYSLRHSFRTVADCAGDQPAANSLMGHADESMRSKYVERIDDARLLAVAQVVRNWLYPAPAEAEKPALEKNNFEQLRIVG